jgi:hypothetical protein
VLDEADLPGVALLLVPPEPEAVALIAVTISFRPSPSDHRERPDDK